MWAKDRNISHFLFFRYLIRVKSRLSFSNLELWMRNEREGDSSRFQFVIRILVMLNMKNTELQNYFALYVKKKKNLKHRWGPEKGAIKQTKKKKRKIHSWIRPHKFSDLQHRGWSHFVVNAFVWIKLRERPQKALKAYVGSLRTQLLCLTMKRETCFSGRSFLFSLFQTSVSFSFFFPLLLKSHSTLITQHLAYQQSPPGVCKANS